MVHVEQHEVVASTAFSDPREHVAFDEVTALVVRECRSEWDERLLVPADHGVESLDHVEVRDAVVVEHGLRLLPEAQAADQHAERARTREISRVGILLDLIGIVILVTAVVGIWCAIGLI